VISDLDFLAHYCNSLHSVNWYFCCCNQNRHWVNAFDKTLRNVTNVSRDTGKNVFNDKESFCVTFKLFFIGLCVLVDSDWFE